MQNLVTVTPKPRFEIQKEVQNEIIPLHTVTPQSVQIIQTTSEAPQYVETEPAIPQQYNPQTTQYTQVPQYNTQPPQYNTQTPQYHPQFLLQSSNAFLSTPRQQFLLQSQTGQPLYLPLIYHQPQPQYEEQADVNSNQVDKDGRPSDQASNFGLKIPIFQSNSKFQSNVASHSQFIQHPAGYNKLVQNTKHMVSGVDVLNINGAVEIENDEVVRNLTNDQLDNSINYQHKRERQGNSLKLPPIVVAEINESQEKVRDFYVSSTPNSIEDDEGEKKFETLRPVSSKFLAPITAALRLKNAGENIENLITNDDPEEETYETKNDGVEIQKSIPYYLGKFDYADEEETKDQESEEVPARIEYFESQKVGGNNTDQFQEEGSQKIDQLIKIEEKPAKIKYVDRPVPVIQPVPVEVEKIVEKPVAHYIKQVVQVPEPYPVEKIVTKPYPIPVPVQIPVEVTKIIEKPVEVTKYVEKPYAVPIPVTKLVEVPKIIDRHIPVKQIVERPYPVYIPYQINQFKHSNQPVYPKLNKYQYNLRYNNEYMGPVPPLMDLVTARRNAQIHRKNFGRNLRIEYGFKPPMQPSVETDELGNPLQKEDNTK